MVLTIGLEPEIMEVNAAHKVKRSEDITRMTLGSATMSQMNGWREEEHPLGNNSTFFTDQRNEWIAGADTHRDNGSWGSKKAHRSHRHRKIR